LLSYFAQIFAKLLLDQFIPARLDGLLPKWSAIASTQIEITRNLIGLVYPKGYLAFAAFLRLGFKSSDQGSSHATVTCGWLYPHGLDVHAFFHLGSFGKLPDSNGSAAEFCRQPYLGRAPLAPVIMGFLGFGSVVPEEGGRCIDKGSQSKIAKSSPVAGGDTRNLDQGIAVSRRCAGLRHR
jgi:hypothetical protein